MQNLENENSEQESSWDEDSFAKLLGLNDEKTPENKTDLIKSEEVLEGEETNQNQVSNPIATHELFDDPQLGKTQPTFYGNPFAKFGVVGLVMLLVFGAAATVLNSIMSGKPRIAPTIANREEIKPKVEIADNSQTTETGKLKAELALSTQAEKIKSVEHSQNTKNPINRHNHKIQNKKISPSVIPKEVPRNQVAYIPRSIPQRVNYNPSRVAYTPRIQPVVSKVNQPTLPKSLPKQEEMINTMEQWREISNLGSYGNVAIASNSKSNSLPNKTLNSTNEKQQIPTIPRATLVSATPNQNQIIPITDDLQIEPLHDEEALIIGNPETPQLTVGTSADGKLIIWANNQVNNANKQSTSQQQSDKFIIQVSKSLETEKGLVILPKNSQIIVQVKDIQKSGFIELEATQVVIDGKEYALPKGAIAIRGSSGKPLIASSWGNKAGEIAKRDAETFAVGSLAKVGKVLNQPKEEQTSTNSGFGGTNSWEHPTFYLASKD
ncbi:conjugal transfer protein TrbI [Brunnivagina elsteri]|uniref:conjugal transfer protein TrbI n=1 Tax=Brunnivagina elsteri TaxID=1247191 RepID=UPI001FE64B7F|nr:conjugal transfer protein TrbI [Calothrix elsteri]